MKPDRTVHARYGDKEIVRYDRAGKWYFETTGPEPTSIRVPFNNAVTRARRWREEGRGEVFLNRPGGQTFDKKVRGL